MENIFYYLFKKNHRLIGSLVIFLTVPFFVKGQLSFGINGGISRNVLVGNEGYRPLTAYHAENGYTAGMVLQYAVNKFITAGIEPSFLKKDYKIARSDYYQGVYESTRNSYIQLPLVLTFSLGNDKIRGGISGGAYSAYWIHSTKKGEIPNLSNLSSQNEGFTNVFQNIQQFAYDEAYRFDSKLDNRWEFGWVAGANFEYTIIKQVACFTAVRYYYSLTDQGKNYSINQEQHFNETVVVTAGLLFKINTHKQKRSGADEK